MAVNACTALWFARKFGGLRAALALNRRGLLNLAASECPSISAAVRLTAWRCQRRRQFASCDAPRCAAQNGKQYQALEAVAQPHSYCSPALGFRNSVILDAETATPPCFDCSRSCTNRE